MKITLLLCGAALVWIGCAGYRIQPVSVHELDTGWRAGQLKSGYIFYQPELYFLVTPGTAAATHETNGNFNVVPVYLPNYTRPYRLTTHNFLAKNDVTLNLKDGWQLTSIADKADNTTVADTMAGELKTVLTAMLKTTGLQGQRTNVLSQLEERAFLLHPVYDRTGAIVTFDVVRFDLSAD